MEAITRGFQVTGKQYLRAEKDLRDALSKLVSSTDQTLIYSLSFELYAAQQLARVILAELIAVPLHWWVEVLSKWVTKQAQMLKQLSVQRRRKTSPIKKKRYLEVPKEDSPKKKGKWDWELKKNILCTYASC